MSTFGTLYRYEWKKLMQKKLTWISFFVCMAAVLVSVLLPLFSGYYVDGKKTGTAYEVERTDRAYAQALNGRSIDQELLAETVEGYRKIPQNIEGHYTGTPEYQKYARPYSSIFTFIIRSTTLQPSEIMSSWEADEQDFYDRRQEWLSDNWKNAGLTEQEMAFWQEQEDKIEKPFVFMEHDGADKLMKSMQTVGIFVFLLIGIALSGMFSEEHSRKTDALILSSACGKGKLYWAKILAGISFSAGTALLFWTFTWALTLGIYGSGGLDAAFQLFYTRSSAPITYGRALFLAYGCILICALITGIFVMLLSAFFNSSMAALAVTTGLILASMIINVPDTYRIAAQIWDWLPVCFAAPWNVFGCYTLPVLGHCFAPWQAVPVLYILIGLPAAILGMAVYKRYQISK